MQRPWTRSIVLLGCLSGPLGGCALVVGFAEGGGAGGGGPGGGGPGGGGGGGSGPTSCVPASDDTWTFGTEKSFPGLVKIVPTAPPGGIGWIGRSSSDEVVFGTISGSLTAVSEAPFSPVLGPASFDIATGSSTYAVVAKGENGDDSLTVFDLDTLLPILACTTNPIPANVVIASSGDFVVVAAEIGDTGMPCSLSTCAIEAGMGAGAGDIGVLAVNVSDSSCESARVGGGDGVAQTNPSVVVSSGGVILLAFETAGATNLPSNVGVQAAGPSEVVASIRSDTMETLNHAVIGNCIGGCSAQFASDGMSDFLAGTVSGGDFSADGAASIFRANFRGGATFAAEPNPSAWSVRAASSAGRLLTVETNATRTRLRLHGTPPLELCPTLERTFMPAATEVSAFELDGQVVFAADGVVTLLTPPDP